MEAYLNILGVTFVTALVLVSLGLAAVALRWLWEVFTGRY